jgi:hypothetical protein
MELQEIEWSGVDRIRVTQNRDKRHAVMLVLMKLPLPLNAANFLTAWKYVRSSKRNMLCGFTRS